MSDFRIIQGDALASLVALPDRSVHCIVTSPPFWCLRQYPVPPTDWPEVTYVPMVGLPPIVVPAHSAPLGLEPTPEAFVAHIVLICRELRRVLRNDGSMWFNMGDTAASSGRGGGGAFMETRREASWKGASELNGWRKAPPGFNRKDLVGIPWRCAFALQADGWILRSDVVLHKIAAMPQSAVDRPMTAHEPVFLFSKRAKYYYDRDAVLEPVSGGAHTRGGGVGGKTVPPGKGAQGRIRNNESYGRAMRELVTRRNMRSVWAIRPEQNRSTHHATFPRAVPRPAILAGSSEAGACAACGAPRKRRVLIECIGAKPDKKTREPSSYASSAPAGTNPHSFAVRGSHGVISKIRRTLGWDPTCKCDAETVPCVILDPFCGSGTVGDVAVTHGRAFIGIDLSEKDAREAARRIARAAEIAGRAKATDELPSAGAHVQLGLLAGDEWL